MVARWFFMFVGSLAAVGPALVYWFGAHQAIAHTITLGTVIAFVAYLANLYRPMGQLANIYVDLQGALAVFDRIFAYLDLVPDVQERPNAIGLPRARGRITFDHVSFAYPPPPPATDSAAAGGDGEPWAGRGYWRTAGRQRDGVERGQWGRGLGLGRLGSSGSWTASASAPSRGRATASRSGDGARRTPVPGRAPDGAPAAPDALPAPLNRRPGRPPGPGRPAGRQHPRLALDDVWFTIEPGQLVALVGPSGSGKTTTTYLVPRFYDPTAGRVLLDDHDLRDLTLDSLAAQMGMVTQESFLFHATIRENLLYARPAATEAELVASCKAANIHHFIEELPQGYDTVVGERGFRLSGGERQRVSIARAMLKDPRILILDEATSSLDSTAEALIQEALEPLMRGRTSLVIAHRLSTILAADKILVLDGGKLVEEGTHEALLAHGGLFARLYRIQFRQRRPAPAAKQALPASPAPDESAALAE
jgi:ATP-binding cassette subfamily B protein